MVAIAVRRMHLALALVACAGFAACGWESDGLQRLEELYPSDLGTDLGQDLGTDAGTDTSSASDAPTDVPADTQVIDQGSDPGADTPDVGAIDAIADAPADVPGDVPADTSGPKGLEGRWVVRVVQMGRMTPIVNETDVTVTDLFIGEVAPGSGKMALTFCDELQAVTPVDGSDFLTVTPQKLKDALANAPIDLPLGAGGETLPAAHVVWMWGLKGVGESDALPTDKTDPLVVDQDEDGFPGVTVHIAQPIEGDRYMVKRAIIDLAAGDVSPEFFWVAGALQFKIDQKAVDADPSFLKQDTPITSLTTGNFYQMKRDATTTCVDLALDADAAFKGVP